MLADVYMNLPETQKQGKPVYSVRDRVSKRVVDSTHLVYLRDAKMHVGASMAAKTFAGGKKTVHAWVTGERVKSAPSSGWVRIRYNPRELSTFVIAKGSVPIFDAEWAKFDGEGAWVIPRGRRPNGRDPLTKKQHLAELATWNAPRANPENEIETTWTRADSNEKPDKYGRLHWWATWTNEDGPFIREPSKIDGKPVGYRRGQYFFISEEDVAERKTRQRLPRSYTPRANPSAGPGEVDVFLNLNQTKRLGVPIYSVRENKIVVDHVPSFVMRDPKMHVGVGSQKRIAAGGEKMVHAWLTGERGRGAPASGWVRIRYNPKEMSTFIYAISGKPVYEARWAKFDSTGVWVIPSDGTRSNPRGRDRMTQKQHLAEMRTWNAPVRRNPSRRRRPRNGYPNRSIVDGWWAR